MVHILNKDYLKLTPDRRSWDNGVMMRILLVIEDINQLASLKVVLLKLGCTVETLSTEVGLKEKLLGFPAEVVITAGSGKKVNPLAVAQKSRETSSDARIVLLLNRGTQFSLQDLAESKYDAFIESPFEPLRLISTLNQLVKKANGPDLVEKFRKVNGAVAPQGPHQIVVKGSKEPQSEETISIFGNKFSSPQNESARVKAYKELTSRIKINPQSTITKATANKKMADLQKDWDQDELDQVDEERRRFVKALFSKK